MKNKGICIITTISLLFISIVTVTFFKNKVNDTPSRSLLGDAYLLLLENRLSYVQLPHLNPVDPTFSETYSTLRGKIRSSNGELQDMFKEGTFDSIVSPTKTINALNRQLELLNMLDAQESLITLLYAYDPQIDLGDLSFDENRLILFERVNAAIQGVRGSVQRAKDDLPTLENDTREVIESLTVLLNTLEGNDIAQMESALSVAITDYNQLKTSQFNQQLTLIRSDDAVGILTELTNVLIDVKNFLDSKES